MAEDSPQQAARKLTVAAVDATFLALGTTRGQAKEELRVASDSARAASQAVAITRSQSVDSIPRQSVKIESETQTLERLPISNERARGEPVPQASSGEDKETIISDNGTLNYYNIKATFVGPV